ncbi:hypothetical protein, partial [Mesorhizobium sp.]|uniref:hypothetical protein n=1 Tax=Mesorhizobium sp. TaxID=1871066 RepID=UPI0025D24520
MLAGFGMSFLDGAATGDRHFRAKVATLELESAKSRQPIPLSRKFRFVADMRWCFRGGTSRPGRRGPE